MGDFFYHAFGVASRSKLLNEGATGVANTLSLAGTLALDTIGIATLALVALGVAGAVRLALRDREGLVLVGVPVLLVLGFSLLYAIHDIENYLILPFWLLALSAGAAVSWIPFRIRPVVTAALAFVLVVSGVTANRRTVDRSDYHVVDDFVTNTMRCVPERAALFLFMETLVGPFLYHQAVEGMRPDVELVDMSGKVVPQEYGFRGLTGDWREKRWRRMESLYETPLPALRGRAFTTVTTEVRPATGEPFAYRRRGVVHELVPAGSPAVESHGYWERFRVRLPDPVLLKTEMNTFMLTPLVLDMYTDTALAAAAEYVARGDIDAAIATYRSVLDFASRATLPRLALADLYRRKGRLENAAEELEFVAEQVPEDAGVLSALGVIRLSQGRRADAERLFRQSVAVQPDFALARLNLGDLLMTDPARRAEALGAYRLFLRLAPGDPAAPRVREILAEHDAASPSR